MIFWVALWTFPTFFVSVVGLGTELRGTNRAQQSYTNDKPMKSLTALKQVSTMIRLSGKPHGSELKNFSRGSHRLNITDHDLNFVQKQLQLGSGAAHVHITLDGFTKPFLNGRYFAQPDEKKINGEITYQHSSGNYFLWWSAACHAWWISWEGNRELAATRSSCSGWAYAPSDKDVLDPARIQGWSQWTDGHWTMLPRAGVYGFSCGAFNSGDLCSDAKNCQWDGKLCKNEWSIIQDEVGVKYSDIMQGQLATCYFLTALASVANYHPKIIADMFDLSKWKGKNPVITTTWMLNGKPTKVAVDDFVPVDDEGEPRFVTYNDGFDFWPLVLEKSWAKIYRSYKDVQFGWSIEVFKAITQAPVTRIKHSDVTKEDLWTVLQMAYAQKWPTASLTTDNTTNNLAPDHAWSCLGSGEMGNKKYVKLYNPISREWYKGALQDDKNDGIFRMTFDEYFSAFTYTSFARVVPDYVTSSKSLPISMTKFDAEQQFTMGKEDPFTVQLQWPGARDIHSTGCPSFSWSVSLRVCHQDTQKCVAGKREGWESVFRADMPGAKGTYVVSIFTQFSQSWVKEYTLTTYAAESTEFQDVAAVLVAKKQAQAAILSRALVQHGNTSQGANVSGTAKFQRRDSMSCEEAVARRGKLNNAKDMAKGDDPLFPHNSTSIARFKGAMCGDPAQNINVPCDGKWASFRDIMKKQAR